MAALTIEQLTAIMPRPSVGRLKHYVAPLNATFDRYGIDTPRARAFFLAQAAHESLEFQRFEENLLYRSADRLKQMFRIYRQHPKWVYQDVGDARRIGNRVYADRLGNGDFLSGDGFRHRGRGIFMLTGRRNYAKAQKATGFNLLDWPEQLTLPEQGCIVAGWYWNECGLTKLAEEGDWEGITNLKRAAMYDDEDDFIETTERINGPALVAQKERERYLFTAREVFGVH